MSMYTMTERHLLRGTGTLILEREPGTGQTSIFLPRSRKWNPLEQMKQPIIGIRSGQPVIRNGQIEDCSVVRPCGIFSYTAAVEANTN